ncbi:rhodanese-like domain-containing protein [Acidiluteibacter ferrifornacis]|uniref:Rhodanese-like domain-containing protein n=1 Tax=Acidiluteibacter ferrifornacis TaxID=2692424 RepID=A0A6N9NEE7_9FLAO|nr:rhodanese-like domain-containing protein [Acidiluteibacter ferrifornacis]MBR9830983.1 rhodanese-like domain-containing protein [bacterium]NBG65006.1 rhodanese-like domain-containing protein [Acidiluteibacter ferrifornacis]
MEKKTIVDVRSIEEFKSGHVEGSINIPLQEVPEKVEEFKTMEKPIILCCKSGYRSEQAMLYLRQFGIDCENGGGWTDLI